MTLKFSCSPIIFCLFPLLPFGKIIKLAILQQKEKQIKNCLAPISSQVRKGLVSKWTFSNLIMHIHLAFPVAPSWISPLSVSPISVVPPMLGSSLACFAVASRNETRHKQWKAEALALGVVDTELKHRGIFSLIIKTGIGFDFALFDTNTVVVYKK